MPLLVKNDFVSSPSGVIEAIFAASAACGSCGEYRRYVLQRIHLRVELRVDAVVAVADADRHDAAEEIEILVAVGVPDVLVLGARDHQRLLVIVKDRGKQKLPIGQDDFVLGHLE